MSILISYNSEAGASSIIGYLQNWKVEFERSPGAGVRVGDFSGRDTPLSGSQYAVGGRTSDYGFIAGSDSNNGLKAVTNWSLDHGSTFRSYFWGKLDSITLGQHLSGREQFSMNEDVVAFRGLGLSATKEEGNPNAVHNIISSLAAGDIDPLRHLLDQMLSSHNLSTAATFDQVAAAMPSIATASPVASIALAGADHAGWDWAFAA